MKDFVRVMKALSDPNRVKIVKMLQHRSLCACELQVKAFENIGKGRNCRLPEGWSLGQLFSGRWPQYALCR